MSEVMKYNNPQEAWYHEMKQRPQGEGCLLSLLSVTFIALAIALMLSFSGCTTMRYVPVEHHTIDTVYQSKLQRDSIWLHDSIFVSQQQRGDTILLTTTKWRTKYIEREVHDTLYRAKVDSIPVPYEVVKEVPRKKSKFEIVVFTIGIIAIMGLIIFIGMKLKKFLP